MGLKADKGLGILHRVVTSSGKLYGALQSRDSYAPMGLQATAGLR